MELTEKLIVIKKRLETKYGIDDDSANDTVEFAVSEYRRLSNDYETSLEDYSSDVLIWIKKACYDIIDREIKGIVAGLKSYSENGYSWTTSGGIISEYLEKEIMANVDYPK